MPARGRMGLASAEMMRSVVPIRAGAQKTATRDRRAGIGFDQAARRYLWCNPPRTGSVATLPRSGGSMLRGNGALCSCD